MNNIKVILSFDDGRADNFYIAKSVLKRYNIPAIFNITTAYVDGSIPINMAPCYNPPMSVEQVISLYNEGYSIAGHGDYHQNSLDDIARGVSKIRDWIGKNETGKIGFASPCSKLTKKEILDKRNAFEKLGISYVRIGDNVQVNFFKRVMRKLAYITGNNKLYVFVFKDSLEKLENQFVIHSVPVMNKNTVEQLNMLLEYAMRHNRDCVLMFHSIVDDGSEFSKDTWSWSVQKFTKLCKILRDKQNTGLITLLNQWPN